MNERIIELAEQAGLEYNYDPMLWMKQEKFAELIVKECAYLVNHQQRTTGYTTHARMLCDEFGIEFKEEDYFGDEK